MALKKFRLKEYATSNYNHKVETRFLERKTELDIIVYSLIRVSDPFIARELYLRVLSKEADIGDLSSQYSEGPEKKVRGIVGPIPIGAAHPRLAKFLQTCVPGEVQQPIKVNDSYLVVRVECFEPAQLDDYMREKMGEELFNIMIDEQTIELRNKLLSSKSY